MADIWTKKKRSEVMGKIRSKDTYPEKRVRLLLSSFGLKYALNVKKLPGTPDMVLKQHRLAIFVHGCFWHQHGRCRDGSLPTARIEYWHPKLHQNKLRDKRNVQALRKMGWQVLKLWECKVKKDPDWVATALSRAVAPSFTQNHQI